MVKLFSGSEQSKQLLFLVSTWR